jgi:hypothetical protein
VVGSWFPELATSDVVATAAVLALTISAWQLRLAVRAQRRSSQPVVVVHEVSRDMVGTGGMEFRVYLENHGVSPAFNARFGVELDGTPYPYSFGDDASRGARQVVPPGARVPPQDEFELRASFAPYLLTQKGPGVGDRRVFWARYENPFGETWETRNPADPTADLEIRRVHRWVARRREQKQLSRRRKDDAQFVKRIKG